MIKIPKLYFLPFGKGIYSRVRLFTDDGHEIKGVRSVEAKKGQPGSNDQMFINLQLVAEIEPIDRLPTATVTKQMLDAGRAIYMRGDVQEDDPDEVLAEIYRAMSAAQSS